MSSANAIIKIHVTENHALDFSSYETGNADFYANGFSTKLAALMILLDAPGEETVLRKTIKEMGAEPANSNWLRENVNTFISAFHVLEKERNISTQEEEDVLRSKIEREENISSTEEVLILYAPTTHYKLEVTNPAYISHLKAGDVFETTAYDMG